MDITSKKSLRRWVNYKTGVGRRLRRPIYNIRRGFLIQKQPTPSTQGICYKQPRRNTNTCCRPTQTFLLKKYNIRQTIHAKLYDGNFRHQKDGRQPDSGLNLSCCPNGSLKQRFSNLLRQSQIQWTAMYELCCTTEWEKKLYTYVWR
jgi:hypothetical protein